MSILTAQGIAMQLVSNKVSRTSSWLVSALSFSCDIWAVVNMIGAARNVHKTNPVAI